MSGLRAALAGLTLLIAGGVAAQDIRPEDRRSGSDFMSAETRALQADDAANPAMLWVRDGEDLWSRVDGASQKSCAACHGDARASMRGAAARYPAIDRDSGLPVTLEQRINLCRAKHQNALPFAPESQPLLSLAAFVALQSRGLPIAPPDDARMIPFREAGKALFGQRLGQLNLSCSNCHEDNWGRKLGGAPIPQAHPTAYPIYRLEWQGLGSLQRRLRNCLTGVRAEPLAPNAQDAVNLEAFLAWRARGMTIESPGVRP